MGFEQYKELFNKQGKLLLKEVKKSDKIHGVSSRKRRGGLDSPKRETFRTGTTMPESPGSIQGKMKRNYLRDWARIIKPKDWKLGKTSLNIKTKSPDPKYRKSSQAAIKINRMIKSGARAEKIFYDPKNIKWMKATRVKQVLPIVGRTIGVASGWGTLIAGASLLAQTKKAKKFRQDPIHRRATIKKLFKVRN